jgi:hypothetical protein
MQLEETIENLNSLKFFRIEIKKAQFNQELKLFFQERMKNIKNLVRWEFIYYNAMGTKE